MKLLIANRGEIACRIARTARRLGMATVGVYSEPDRSALHVDAVDVAVALGGVSSADSYLRGDLILAAAATTGATAVHPGYGFLAENAEFAEHVIAAGLTWVGPTPDQIRLLGDKVAAKRAAAEAGVPTTPVIEIDGGTVPDGVTLPALVKAAAGGGGRGMRLVHDGDDLGEAIASASREALAAFGDGTVFIEPFIERGRHVEVQVFGDTFGNVIHLGDRECSVQRRNQKVIEEAPSPGIDDEVRERLLEGAVALARHVGYVGAGTVEFMVADGVDGGEATITFLEVNTRLQVEHPVSEAVTGLDLVELQLLVAQGRPLPLTQADVTVAGHAIEVRVVSEDPSTGWLPSTGVLSEYSIGDPDVRVDSGYRAGDEVTTAYDSLLTKVVAHRPEREAAARVLARTLRTARIAGIRTNAATLANVLVEPDFLAGRTYTSYLDEHPDVVASTALTPEESVAHFLAAVFALEHENRRNDGVLGFAPSGWRNLRTRGQRRSLVPGSRADDSEAFVAEYEVLPASAGVPVTAEVLLGHPPAFAPDGALLPDDRRRVRVRVLARDDAGEVVEIDGIRHAVEVAIGAEERGRRTILTSSPAGTESWTSVPRFVDHDTTELGSGPVSPLPGTVIAVHVTAGETVEPGQLLMVVEAMKMEHKITAPVAATVIEVHFALGDRVDAGDLLVALDAEGDG